MFVEIINIYLSHRFLYFFMVCVCVHVGENLCLCVRTIENVADMSRVVFLLSVKL